MNRKDYINYFNEYKIINDLESEFYIINRKGEQYTIKVDTEILYKLIEFNRSWNISWTRCGYYIICIEYLEAVNGKYKYRTHYLHRFIFDYPENSDIDHINHDTLDNRKENLRVTLRKNNSTNRNGRNRNNKTGYRNVSYQPRNGNKPYIVQIQINGKNTRLGSFSDVEEAGAFAEKMRQKYYGEFAGEG